MVCDVGSSQSLPTDSPTDSPIGVKSILSKKTIIGILIWCGIVALGAIGLHRASDDSPAAAPQIVRFLTSQTRDVQIQFDSRQLVAVNDPVFVTDSESARPVGRISRLGPPGEHRTASAENPDELKIDYVQEATVTLFGGAPKLRSDAKFVLQSTPKSTEWAIKTMLPKEKRRELVTLIMDSYRRHMPEIAAAFQPVVKDSLASAGSVIKDELQIAFKEREEEFLALGKRFETELLQEKIVPLLQDEVWPVVEEQGAPLAQKIGTEIWKELSLWRFGWRFLYDKSPLPERNFTQNEFNRFIKSKAAPIMKAHLPEIMELQKSLVTELSELPEVRKTVRESFQTVVDDQEVRALLTNIFKDVLIDNPRLRETMEQQWTGERARAAIDLASRRLDPTINRIGETMFGNRDSEITPEFARVMRRMVLSKDQRWFMLDPGSVMGDDAVTSDQPSDTYRALVGSKDALIPSLFVPDHSAGQVD